jgi:hypothetical protein
MENLRRNAQRIAPQYGLLAGLPVNNSAPNFAGAAKNVGDGIEAWIEGVYRLIRTDQNPAEGCFVRLE